jgi:predicted alpha/beta hydrolase family esterase
VNREKAASHFHDVKAIFSDDDPWVPVSNSIDFHEKLGAEVIMESGMGHIYRKDPEK